MIKYVFFDLGSTLIDESDCIECRIQDLLQQPGAPARDELERRMIELTKQNKLPYKDAAREYGLTMLRWPTHLEKLYDGTEDLLKALKPRYKLGIIANQNLGTEERLRSYGIDRYFDVIVASAEAGINKPDPAIFKLALEKAGCLPEESIMVGDRLDNDIEPAAALGMHTIWVRQGSFAYGNPDLIEHKPDHIVDRISEITGIL